MVDSLFVIIFVLLFSILLPVGLVVWWRRRSGEKLWPFLVGAICFILFAMVLENILHGICLVGENPISVRIQASPVLYTLYTCLAAGVFEETGRLFGFNVLLKNRRNRECAVAYGIGHGGIEVLLILTVSYVLLLAVKCGAVIGDAATAEAIRTTADTMAPGTAALAMLERVSAMIAHVGKSMLVFVAARQPGRFWLYPCAVLCHACLDLPAVLYQFGVLKEVLVVEAAVFVLALAIFFLGRRALRSYRE